MAWVFSSAPTTSPVDLLVLLAIADHCADDGRGAYPSVARLAAKTRLSERSVQRAVSRLQTRGVLSVNVSAGRGATNVYTINLGRQTDAPDRATRVPSRHLPDDGRPPDPRQNDTVGSDKESPDPSIERSSNQLRNRHRQGLGVEDARLVDGVDDPFERFWTTYPKKVAKEAARKAWTKLKLSGAEVTRIMSALETHKLTLQWHRNGGQFIPHAASWLNGRRWEDEGLELGRDQTDAAWEQLLSRRRVR
jgi:hypothetical protein